jgi:hypothetical protein
MWALGSLLLSSLQPASRHPGYLGSVITRKDVNEVAAGEIKQPSFEMAMKDQNLSQL